MSVTAITSRRAASALGTAELSRGGWACAQLHCLRLARIRIGGSNVESTPLSFRGCGAGRPSSDIGRDEIADELRSAARRRTTNPGPRRRTAHSAPRFLQEPGADGLPGVARRNSHLVHATL